MHYFSIHTQDGEHAGFFIMLADDESQNPPQSGRFAIKLQSEDAAEAAVLSPFEQTDIPQYWRVV
ncbi:HLGFF motif protein, partial [Neisseria sp. P0006.S006]